MKSLEPLTGKQCELIEEWYRYAITVAFDQAIKPYDEDEVVNAAHDALISAVKYFRQDSRYGKATFAAFYKFCLLRRLHRTYVRRHNIVQLPPKFDTIDGHVNNQPREVREFVQYLRRNLPAHYEHAIIKCFDQGISPGQLAKQEGRNRQCVESEIKIALRLMRRRAERSFIPAYVSKPRSKIGTLS